MNVPITIAHAHASQERESRIVRECKLSHHALAIAGELERALLIIAPEARITMHDRMRFLRLAEIVISRIRPGAESRARGRSRVALEDLVHNTVSEIRAMDPRSPYNSFIERGARDMGKTIALVGHTSVLAAYEGSLESER